MRGDKPFLFTNLKSEEGLDEVIQFIKTKGMI
jgi:urease accessory protein